MIDWIKVFQSEIEKDEMSANQNFFELWQAWYHKNQAFLDNKGLNNDDTPIKKRTAGTLKGKVVFHDGFDEPLDDFRDYM